MAAGLANKAIHINAELPLESDITDLRFIIQNDMPARPGSRLGFNRTRSRDSPLLEENFIEEAHPESIRGTVYSPSRRQVRAGLAELECNITALAVTRDTTSQMPSEGTPSSLGAILGDKCTTNETFILEGDDLLDVLSAVDNPSCKRADNGSDATSMLPISGLSLDPISMSFDPSETSTPSAPKRFSCLPSPFSPQHIASYSLYRYPPQRHRYRHHGYSRHTLHYLKWFWATRESWWMEFKAHSYESNAYDGLSVFGSESSGLRLLGIPSEPTEALQYSPLPSVPSLPPLSIHPRRGDLSALRDPYCMHIDRYFVGMPLWTMAKTLWMFDVHMASSAQKDAARAIDDDFFDEEQSEGESIETSGSHAFSDDSDTTLVESESEGEVEGCGDRLAHLNASRGQGKPTPERKDVMIPDAEYESDFELLTPSQPVATSSVADLVPSLSPQWATCWYRRWEVLLHLCIENNPSIIGDANLLPVTSSTKTQQCMINDDWVEALPGEQEEVDELDDDNVEYSVAKKVLVVVNDERSDRLSLLCRSDG